MPIRSRSIFRLIAKLALVLAVTLPTFAVEAGQTAYIGGTSAIPKDTIGRLDTTVPTALVFHYAGQANASDLTIPYDRIRTFAYHDEVTVHLGVIAHIIVSLLKPRARRHFFTITYSGSDNVTQVAIFEVPKEDPLTLSEILKANVPHGCDGDCGLHHRTAM